MGFVNWLNYKRVIWRYPEDFVIPADTGLIGVGHKDIKSPERSGINRLSMH